MKNLFAVLILLVSFHESTKLGKKLELKRKKEVKIKKVKLPKPDFKGMSLEDAIRKRRSVRDYSGKPMNLKELSQLLFATYGKTGDIHGVMLRSAPSAGALYPFEVYTFVNNVEGLEKGIYHYNSKEHTITLIKKGDFKSTLVKASLWQDMVGEANVTFALVAVFERTTRRYGERGLRYIYMEAGHISQNIYLQATSMGMGSVAIGAFYDDEVNKLIGLDGKREAVVYLHAVGKI